MSFFASRIRLSVALLVSLVGCSGDGPSHTDPKTPSAPALQGHAAVDDDDEIYRVRFETTKGPFVVEVHPAWAPLGAARFKELVTSGYYDGCKFFRVVPGFVVQWGMHGDPNTNAKWQENRIPDDPVVHSNKRATITFATSGPDSRTSQLFINFADNTNLDGMGFAPFGEVVEGIDVVDQITAEYGEAPDQGRIRLEGNEYLNSTFPRMDGILTASLVEDSAKSGEEPLQQVPAQDTVPGTDKKAVPADAAEGTSL